MSVKRLQGGVLVAPVRLGDVRAALVAPDLASADLSNVIPFARQRAVRPAPEIPSPSEERPADGSFARERMRLAAFAAISLLIHVGLFAMFWREPEPLASIGEQVISVEIVVGATAPAGVAQAPGESEAQAAPAEQVAEVSREAEQKATEQPQDVPVAAEERAPEQTAKTDTPVDPKVIDAAKPDETKPRPAQSDTEVALLPPPEEKPAEQPKSQPKAVKNATPTREPRRVAAPTREHAQKQAKATPSAPAANNVGVGRSDANSNYAGIVSAHLRRHQQYPSDARSRGEQGTATVSFSLDGSGRVTSSRLVRGSGVASIDHEVQAMVRRSSPFPPPPSGHGVSFTVPVSFRLN